MTNGMIAFFLAAGVLAWVYSKVSRSTGNNAKSSLIVSGVAGLFAFILMIIILGLIPKD